VFVPVARYRGLDADEGYYALAAKLVAHGSGAYADFWWPQMPLYPYVYGAWLEIFGETWESARAASVLLSAGIGLLIYAYASRRLQSGLAGVAAVVVYASTHLVFDWLLIAKPYALATLPLLAAVVLVEVAGEASPRRWAAAGLLAGLAVDVRLFFAAAAVVLMVHACRTARAGARLRTGAAFAGGLTIGLLPSIYLFLSEPGRFAFDNLGYHLHRTQGGRFGSLDQKLEIVAGLVNDDPQFLLLLTGALASVASAVLLRRRIPLAVWVAAALAFASLTPNPAFIQDFATVVPFMLLAVVEFAGDVSRLAGARRDARIATVLAGAALAAVALYAVSAAINFTRPLDNYGGISFIGDTATLDGLSRVADAIDRNARPGERVLSLWPAPLLESHARPVAGFENDYAPRGVETAGVSASDAARYRMGTTAHLTELISGRRVRVVIVSPLGIPATDKHTSAPARDWEAMIRASGYRRRALVGHTGVYVRGRP
jgi:4-amino-4-deoxy-L-arabinose transferase-like glycosyltransferase